MPNTLAHLAINGLATRSLIRGANLKWIFLGAIIPDIPWILQRVVKLVAVDVNLLDHIIIGTEGDYSFADSGLLNELREQANR